MEIFFWMLHRIYRLSRYGNFMLIKMQVDTGEIGELQVNVVDSNNVPIKDAKVIIRRPRQEGDPQQNQVQEIEQLQTDSSGQTQVVDLDAPPLELSLDENNDLQPYANYDVEIDAPGYETENIENVEILSRELSIQNVKMRRVEGEDVENINISPHTLYYEYPPKIPEDDIKDVGEPGEIVLSRVVVPEYVVVHDGTPSSNANDYYVTYKD